MKSPTPLDMKLYNKIKAQAKRKFKVWPSAYGSSYLVKQYKKEGGRYSVNKPSKKSSKRRSTGLSRWYAEKWVNICTSPRRSCGRPTTSMVDWKKQYPYCRPSKRINKTTPKTVSELSKSEIKKRCSRKQKNPLKRLY